MRFRHQNKPFYRYQNKTNTENQLQLDYSTNMVDTAIYEKFVCYNHTTKYTD